MHRGGTSLMTRGLAVMGVELGNNFIPTIDEVNKKGFWEDRDFNAFDEELLGALKTTWHNLAPIDADDVKTLRDQGYLLRAIKLIRKKTNGVPIFGFKDPRASKLLPFWREVFSNGNFDVSYVITIRHPLSVVKSLSKRDGFEQEQGYLLWLGHVITILSDSVNHKRVMVDYDCLMQSPDKELRRIAKDLSLEVDNAELTVYIREFLDPGLRHTTYSLCDLQKEKLCPPLVQEIYANLLDVTTGRVLMDNDLLQRKVVSWVNQYWCLRPLLTFIDKISARDKYAIHNAVLERDAKINEYHCALLERDALITNLNHNIEERDALITARNHDVEERDALITNLNHNIEERDALITARNHDVEERDALITNLNHNIEERDALIMARNHDITDLKISIKEKDQTYNNLINTKYYKFGKTLKIL